MDGITPTPIKTEAMRSNQTVAATLWRAVHVYLKPDFPLATLLRNPWRALREHSYHHAK